ncbi:MAG TPA: replication-associated recombination protein A [Nitrospiria bacterium]|jgi:putative ATPase
MDLFDKEKKEDLLAPLADRMRPRSLEEFVGQEHLVREGGILSKIATWKRPPSMIFWGPPGSGKTTLAQIIAKSCRSHFVFFSAVLAGVKNLREMVVEAKHRARTVGQATLLFVDEIHRFNKSQQDAFLPHVEDGTLTLLGATTENPSFEVNAPLLSRCKVLVLRPLLTQGISRILKRALEDSERGLGGMKVVCSQDLLGEMAEWAQGDARRALNLLETAVLITPEKEGKRVLAKNGIKEAAQERPLLFDKDREEHYHVISAFIKSMRGSDPDAAIYWLARMLESGEDPLFIARRMIIFASEDVGNADPQALPLAVAGLHAFQAVGLPEGWIPLSQVVTYLSSAPKSNASYLAYQKAVNRVKEKGSLSVPLHLRNPSTRLMKGMGYGKEYQYPHDFPDQWVSQDYLPQELVGEKYYIPGDSGVEGEIKKRLENRGLENKHSESSAGETI